MFDPGLYTFEPFDYPVFVESVDTVTVDTESGPVAYDSIVSDVGEFTIAAGTFGHFATAAEDEPMETIRTMAARFRAHSRHAPAGARPLPLRYAVAARMLADNVAEHPEIAGMTFADAYPDMPDSPMFRSQA